VLEFLKSWVMGIIPLFGLGDTIAFFFMNYDIPIKKVFKTFDDALKSHNLKCNFDFLRRC
tara:strand:+ start:1098 stop:1277 length:180 start_codon:yes stop_codon:yes gene_type:complete